MIQIVFVPVIPDPVPEEVEVVSIAQCIQSLTELPYRRFII